MDLQITFRHMEHTPALDDIIRAKASKFEKWLHGTGKIHWTCFKEKNDFISEVKIHHQNKDYFAKAADMDMYKTFDMVVHKLQKQIEKDHF